MQEDVGAGERGARERGARRRLCGTLKSTAWPPKKRGARPCTPQCLSCFRHWCLAKYGSTSLLHTHLIIRTNSTSHQGLIRSTRDEAPMHVRGVGHGICMYICTGGHYEACMDGQKRRVASHPSAYGFCTYIQRTARVMSEDGEDGTDRVLRRVRSTSYEYSHVLRTHTCPRTWRCTYMRIGGWPRLAVI